MFHVICKNSINLLFFCFFKYKFIIKRATFKSLKFSFVSIFCRYLGLLFCRKSDYTLVIKGSSDKEEKGKISINSFDYSMFIRNTHDNKFANRGENLIVYLDTGAPLFKADFLLSGNKHPLTMKSWYPALVDFFDVIENKTSKKVVIAAHPKHQFSNDMNHYFGNRDIVHNKTQELISQAALVLVTNSTAVSYAVMYSKPVIIIVSNELLQDDNILLRDAKNLSNIGANVVGLTQKKRKKHSLLFYEKIHKKVNVIFGDITDKKLIKRILKKYKIEICFHLAAQVEVGLARREPYGTWESNIRGTYTLLDSLRENRKNIKSIIIASSDKAYGEYGLKKMPYKEEIKTIDDYIIQIDIKENEKPFDVINCDGKEVEIKAEGLLATCLQHEIDHLEGTLFIDHLSRLKRNMIVKKLTKEKKLKEAATDHNL